MSASRKTLVNDLCSADKEQALEGSITLSLLILTFLFLLVNCFAVNLGLHCLRADPVVFTRYDFSISLQRV